MYAPFKTTNTIYARIWQPFFMGPGKSKTFSLESWLIRSEEEAQPTYIFPYEPPQKQL